ncbi:MAG: hypothetical protein KC777_09830 [Cyanobacteria bacterium HKST-UBA02]|nr:hypothetical protein [Cyanobacteria bacterium HKST-UBA02]
MKRFPAIVAVLLTVVVFLTFNQALSCFFVADDFWHLPMLYRAFHGEPVLLWKNFWSPWIGAESFYLFYRPFTELSLALDYLIHEGQARGYHLSNLLYHCLNSFLVYLFARKLLVRFAPSGGEKRLIPFMISLLFAVHPVNVEPVSWILARADLLGASLYLLTLIMILSDMEKGSKSKKIGGLVLMALAMLSKEACVTLPAAVTVLYLASAGGNLKSAAREALKKTMWMWLILAVYLSLRALALGTAVGGYVGAIGSLLNQSIPLRVIVPSTIWKLLHPFNAEIVQAGDPLEICLRIIYAVTGILLAVNVMKGGEELQKRSRLLIFLAVLTALLTVVNLQVWYISSSMTGSRIAYLILPSLLIITVTALYPPERKSRQQKLLSLAVSLTLLAAAAIFAATSARNLEAWVEAGRQGRAIASELAGTLSTCPPASKLAVVNVPAIIKGVPIFFDCGYIPAMVEPPFTARDGSRRIVCLDGAPLVPPQLNTSLLRNAGADPDLKVVYWNRYREHFEDLPDFPALADPPSNLPVKNAGRYASVLSLDPDDMSGIFHNLKKGEEIESAFIEPGPSLGAPGTVAIDLTITNLHPGEEKEETSRFERSGSLDDVPYYMGISSGSPLATVSFDARQTPVHFRQYPINIRLRKQSGSGLYRLYLSEYKQWLFTEHDGVLRIDLPARRYRLERASLVDTREAIPGLAMCPPFDYGQDASAVSKNGTVTMVYDVSSIQGAGRAIFELSRPYFRFEQYAGIFRSTRRNRLSMMTWESEELKGKVTLPDEFFGNKNAFYQFRVAAIENGEIRGTFSDPVTFRLPSDSAQ